MFTSRLLLVRAYCYFATGVDDLEPYTANHDPEAFEANGTNKRQCNLGGGSRRCSQRRKCQRERYWRTAASDACESAILYFRRVLGWLLVGKPGIFLVPHDPGIALGHSNVQLLTSRVDFAQELGSPDMKRTADLCSLAGEQLLVAYKYKMGE